MQCISHSDYILFSLAFFFLTFISISSSHSPFPSRNVHKHSLFPSLTALRGHLTRSTTARLSWSAWIRFSLSLFLSSQEGISSELWQQPFFSRLPPLSIKAFGNQMSPCFHPVMVQSMQLTSFRALHGVHWRMAVSIKEGSKNWLYCFFSSVFFS